MNTPAADSSDSRATAGALRLGRTVGAALSQQRVLEPTEAKIIAIAGFVLPAIAIVAALRPRVVTVPLAGVLLWISAALVARARGLRSARRARGLPVTRLGRFGDRPPPR